MERALIRHYLEKDNDLVNVHRTKFEPCGLLASIIPSSFWGRANSTTPATRFTSDFSPVWIQRISIGWSALDAAFRHVDERPIREYRRIERCVKLRLRAPEPRYFLTKSGCSRIASEIEQKMTPAFASSSLKVVTTETLSNTASIAAIRGKASGIVSISSLTKESNGDWRGTAMKDGKQVIVSVDIKANVTNK